jgi:hypothetical protein
MASITNILEQTSQQFAANASAITGTIGASVLKENPYMSLVAKGNFDSNTASTHTAITEGRAVSGTSRARPEFIAQSASCNAPMFMHKSGSTSYQYSPKVFIGTSEPICISGAQQIYKGQIMQRYNKTVDLVKEIIWADIRANLIVLSGLKYVATTGGMATGLTGGVAKISTAFAAVQSDTDLTFAQVQDLAKRMRTNFNVKPFGSGEDKHLRLIASEELQDKLRMDSGSLADYRAIAAGGSKDAEKTLKGYTYTPTYRGIAYGTEEQPERYTYSGGVYTVVEPEIEEVSTTGSISVPNPAWINAPYESALLVGDDNFRREVPLQFTGEGPAKFQDQNFGGKVEFLNIRDNKDNIFADKGFFAFRIGVAYRPMNAHHVCAIIFKRCTSYTLTTCAGLSS